MRIKILIALFGFVAFIASAQITTGEQPYGLLMQKQGYSPQNIPIQRDLKTFTNVYKAQIAQEDLVNDAKPGPLRYAFAVPVDYTLENSGTWQKLQDGGKLWRLKVSMSGALSTNTYYDKFWLPEGTKFFVYSEDTKQTIGAITSQYIGGNKENPVEFATAIVYGEDVVYEYYQPASVKESAVISISRIDYGYRYVNNPYQVSLRSFGQAYDCNININCPTGNDWQMEKHAVARAAINSPNGSGWCSCALMNNTSNNYTPYVLTANHCLLGLDAISNNNASQWVFYWEYEHPGCANYAMEPPTVTTVGATVKANNTYTDFALLQLMQDPRNNSMALPYYLGWDRSANPPGNAVGIHHPAGDTKKISEFDEIYANNYTLPPPLNSQPGTHWVANVYNGTTEGGSSGSPLINLSRRVIGQLHGGVVIYCMDAARFYGRFDLSWTGNNATDSRRRLKDWLDPINSNPQTVNGLMYNINEIFFAGTVTQSSCNCDPRQGFNQYLDGPYSVCPGNFEIYFIANKTDLTFSYSQSSSGSYYFSNMGGGYYSITGSFGNNVGNMVTFTFTSGTTSRQLAFYVECGNNSSSRSSSMQTAPAQISSVNPNPVSDVLHIDFDRDAIAQTIEQQPLSAYISKNTLQVLTFNIRLYDSYGVLMRQATSNGQDVELYVSNLPGGLYYVYVDIGVDTKPEIHKIIIKK
jgi:hypothetical protein